ncbi:hypothetical protein [uncultured Oscillibacter sp.]|uniref:hypothetical protein n=1 Tax=uncultured Oscillibacter sp. TaxID=876091 RepID=UPI002609F0F6|nr:hypothetical protein [uncultured Oscillibacter sp.]
MGLFDRFAEKRKSQDLPEAGNHKGWEILLAPSSHLAEEVFYGEDGEYRVSFRVNDAFRPAKSHAGEVEMLHTYAPDSEYGEEGACPSLAVQCDDEVYCAVEAYKETGTVPEALALTPLSGPFYFKARIEYYGNLMYFYGMDLCGGTLEHHGLCMVYPKALAGTEAEGKLTAVLDEAAESWSEEREA